MSCDHEESKLPPIPKEIWGIGLGVFFVNLSSVMVRSLFAVYLSNLGMGGTLIGLIEGIAEAMSFLMKMVSGIISDYFRRRKLIIVLGYSFILLSRPLFAIFSSIQAALIGKILDRFGNGIQASPRDALVGDFAPKTIRGACYGLRVSLGTAGSFVGACITFLLMYFHNENFKFVFWLATIPAFIAVLILVFFIKEPEKDKRVNAAPQAEKKIRHPIHLADIPRLGRKYWLLMTVVFVFMIAQLGEAILILHVYKNFNVPTMMIPVFNIPIMMTPIMMAPTVLVIFNFTYSLISYPAGILSDKIGRYRTLIIGFLCLICGDILLASAEIWWVALLGIAFAGAQMAITQSIFMSLVADSVPEDLRGTGFGIYYLVCSISALMSNWGSGIISEIYGHSLAFTISLIIACLALALLFAIRPKKKVQCLESVTG